MKEDSYHISQISSIKFPLDWCCTLKVSSQMTISSSLPLLLCLPISPPYHNQSMILSPTPALCIPVGPMWNYDSSTLMHRKVELKIYIFSTNDGLIDTRQTKVNSSEQSVFFFFITTNACIYRRFWNKVMLRQLTKRVLLEINRSPVWGPDIIMTYSYSRWGLGFPPHI